MAAALEQAGLAGLYEGRHTGRPRKWTSERQQALVQLAHSEGGTVLALLRQIEAMTHQHKPFRVSCWLGYISRWQRRA
jgi:predicted ArsR family transcriptional regulator